MKRTHTLRTFLAGAAAAVLTLSLAIPAGAALAGKTIQVYTGVDVYVDDVKLNLKDANGNPVEAFVYNGTTYLPVRAVGEAVGKVVQWEPSTSSVYLGKHQNSYGISILSMDYFNSSTWGVIHTFSRNSFRDNLGQEYTDAFCLHDSMTGMPWVSYLLNGQYTFISGDFLLSYEDRSSDEVQRLYIYGDDELLYSAETYAGIYPIHFDVNVTGIIELKIQTYTAASSNSFPDEHYGLANVKLYT